MIIYTFKKIVSIIDKLFLYSLTFFVFITLLYNFKLFYELISHQNESELLDYFIPWFFVGVYGVFGFVSTLILKFVFSWENKLEKITEYKIHNPPYLDFIFYNKGFYDMSFVNSKVSKDIHRKFNPWNDYLETEENTNLVFKKKFYSLRLLIENNQNLLNLVEILFDEYKDIEHDYLKLNKHLNILNQKIESLNDNYSNCQILMKQIEENKTLYSKYINLESDLEYSKEVFQKGNEEVERISKLMVNNFQFTKKLLVMFEMSGTLLDYESNYKTENDINNIIDYSEKEFNYDFESNL